MKEKVISIYQPEDAVATKSAAIVVVMSDDKMYYLNGTLTDILQKIESSENWHLVMFTDVFDSKICLNPTYIKKVRECAHVCVSYKEKNWPQLHYVIGCDDTYTLIDKDKSYTGRGSYAKQLFRPGEGDYVVV